VTFLDAGFQLALEFSASHALAPPPKRFRVGRLELGSESSNKAACEWFAGSERDRPGTLAVVRWSTNIALFVGTEVVYVALLAAAVQAGPGLALTAFVLAVAFTMPFLPVYLIVLAGLPPLWKHWQKRLAAITLSPLLVALFVVLTFAGGFVISLLILALPGAMAYGGLVRIPEKSAAAEPPGFPFAKPS
jgi:hypothetical protein